MEFDKKPEIGESKKPEAENYKDIKPEGNTLISEVKDFISNLFSPKESETASDRQDKAEKSDNGRVEIIDGVKHYFDSNGKLYRTDNDLLKNTEYEINDYKFKTDSNGRIVSAEGTLQLKDREGRLPIKDSMDDIGKGDQKLSDQRGHLIPDLCNGPNGLENMIPQDAKLNNGAYKNLENQLAKEVKAGNEVNIKVEPIYSGDSRRPDAIGVTYTINGETSAKIFSNNSEV